MNKKTFQHFFKNEWDVPHEANSQVGSLAMDQTCGTFPDGHPQLTLSPAVSTFLFSLNKGMRKAENNLF